MLVKTRMRSARVCVCVCVVGIGTGNFRWFGVLLVAQSLYSVQCIHTAVSEGVLSTVEIYFWEEERVEQFSLSYTHSSVTIVAISLFPSLFHFHCRKNESFCARDYGGCVCVYVCATGCCFEPKIAIRFVCRATQNSNQIFVIGIIESNSTVHDSDSGGGGAASAASTWARAVEALLLQWQRPREEERMRRSWKTHIPIWESVWHVMVCDSNDKQHRCHRSYT